MTSPTAAVLGELGLLGEFRSVAQIQQRILESERLGFAHALLPARTKIPAKSSSGGAATGTMQHHLCRRIDQAIDLLG